MFLTLLKKRKTKYYVGKKKGKGPTEKILPPGMGTKLNRSKTAVQRQASGGVYPWGMNKNKRTSPRSKEELESFIAPATS